MKPIERQILINQLIILRSLQLNKPTAKAIFDTVELLDAKTIEEPCCEMPKEKKYGFPKWGTRGKI